MEAAVAVVLGAGLGASATLAGSIVNALAQGRREASSWQRQRRETAYSNAIRALLRVRNRRSGMTISAGKTQTFIAKDDLGKFFDDLVDAQHWLSVLLTACGKAHRASLSEASSKLDAFVEAAVDGTETATIAADLPSVYEAVVSAARDDIDR